MPLFDECCVLIPASTLEDFPSDLSDCDARSLLAAWTILWHPSLLAECGQLPAWYRADSPPESIDQRLIAVPQPSLTRLPGGFASRAEKSPTCTWVSGASRAEMLAQLPLDKLPAAPSQGITCGGRTIGVGDFFVEHGSTPVLRAKLGLDAQGIAKTTAEFLNSALRESKKAASG